MGAWITSFVATFAVLWIRQWLADMERREGDRQQGAAEERGRFEKDMADADNRAAGVPEADRDRTLRNLDNGVF